jgi:hypothetical protein
MKFNPAESIMEAAKVFRSYGGSWTAVRATGQRDQDGVLVIPVNPVNPAPSVPMTTRHSPAGKLPFMAQGKHRHGHARWVTATGSCRALRRYAAKRLTSAVEVTSIMIQLPKPASPKNTYFPMRVKRGGVIEAALRLRRWRVRRVGSGPGD